MKQLLLTALLLVGAGIAAAKPAETRLHVTGLTCPSCSYIVAAALKRVETVEIVEFKEGEAEDGLFVLRYDDAATDPQALVATVTGIGYGATLAAEGGS